MSKPVAIAIRADHPEAGSRGPFAGYSNIRISVPSGGYGMPAPVAMPDPEARAVIDLLAAAPDMLAALEAALDAWRYQFDPPEDATQSDLQISGPDFIDWFAQWRETAKAVVAAAKAEGKL